MADTLRIYQVGAQASIEIANALRLYQMGVQATIKLAVNPIPFSADIIGFE